MADLTGTVIESQVDWLSVSQHGRDDAHSLAALAAELGKEETRKGNKLRKWRLMGYEGNHVGAVEWGMRDDSSCLVRLIGDVADRRLTDVLSLAGIVTRLDLAVTWRGEPANPHVGRNAYSEAMVRYKEKARAARPSRIENGDGGSTVYLGSRESEYFLRIYDKGHEAIEKNDTAGIERYRDCWRFELEAKGPLSIRLAKRVNTTSDRPVYVQQYLHDYLSDHGITPPFMRRPDA